MRKNDTTKSIFAHVIKFTMNQIFIFQSSLNDDSKIIVFRNIDVKRETQKIFDVMKTHEKFKIKKRMMNISNSII